MAAVRRSSPTGAASSRLSKAHGACWPSSCRDTDARDLVTRPRHLRVPQTAWPHCWKNSPFDVLGFSNGGQVGMQLAIRHARAVRRLVVASAPFRRDGMVDGFWDGLAGRPTPISPSPTARQTLRLAATPHMRSACSTSIESLAHRFCRLARLPGRLDHRTDARWRGRPRCDPHRTRGAPSLPYPERPPAHRAWKSRRLPRRTRGRSGRSRAAPTGTSFSGQLPGLAGDHHRELSELIVTRGVGAARCA